jgi:hypothetical protein
LEISWIFWEFSWLLLEQDENSNLLLGDTVPGSIFRNHETLRAEHDVRGWVPRKLLNPIGLLCILDPDLVSGRAGLHPALSPNSSWLRSLIELTAAPPVSAVTVLQSTPSRNLINPLTIKLPSDK